jgi:hypothetical protein
LRELCGIRALVTREKVVFVVRFTWSEMSMFDLFLAALSLAPLGLFVLFWRVFTRDTAAHPIYREPEIETTGKRTGGPGHDPSEAAYENGSMQR